MIGASTGPAVSRTLADTDVQKHCPEASRIHVEQHRAPFVQAVCASDIGSKRGDGVPDVTGPLHRGSDAERIQ